MDKFTKISLWVLAASLVTVIYERKVLKDLKQQYKELKLKERNSYFQKYK